MEANEVNLTDGTVRSILKEDPPVTTADFSETRIVAIEYEENGEVVTQTFALSKANVYIDDFVVNGESIKSYLVAGTEGIPRPFDSVTLRLKRM